MSKLTLTILSDRRKNTGLLVLSAGSKRLRSVPVSSSVSSIPVITYNNAHLISQRLLAVRQLLGEGYEHWAEFTQENYDRLRWKKFGENVSSWK